MNKYYYIGNTPLMNLIQASKIGQVENYCFNFTVFPKVEEDIKAILIQAETPNSHNIFENIESLLLPTMITAVNIPIVLIGVLSEKFYFTKYQIPFYPLLKESKIQYFQLFNDDFELITNVPNVITKSKNIFREYLLKINFKGKLYHDLRKFRIEYRHIDFDKYNNLYNNIIKIIQL